MALPVAIGLGVMAANLIGNQINSAAEQEQKEQGRKYLAGAQSSANSAYNNIINGLDAYYKQRGGLGTAQDAAAYKQAIEGYDPDSFVYTPGQFNAADYGVGSREDYINPYYDQIIGDTAEQVQQPGIPLPFHISFYLFYHFRSYRMFEVAESRQCKTVFCS